MKSIIPWLIILFIFLSTFAAAESYKYTDEDGVVHFTDNPYLIPESEKSNTQIYEDKKHVPSLVIENNKEVPEPGDEDSKAVSTTQDPQLKAEYDELELEKQALAKALKALRQEKEQYRKMKLNNKSLSGEKKAERKKKGHILNKKIEEYNKRQTALNQKIDTFNVKAKKGTGKKQKKIKQE